MKNLKVTYLLTLALFISAIGYAQQQAVTNIQRNINRQAAGLEQSLNFTLDTLTLRSNKNILRVTFLSHDEKDSTIIDVDAPEIKIPLYHFKKGRYTIAVYREDKIIALGVKRVEDISIPKDAIADLEESILRSSLSDKELLNRNIKPLKKTRTRENDTRLAVVKPKRNSVKTTRKSPIRKTRASKTDKRVAVATPKTNRSKNSSSAVYVKRNSRAASSSNKKSGFELAAEREAARSIAAARAKKQRPEKQTTIIEVKKVTYNLTTIRDKSIESQSREDYRANNLRPNGTRYQN